MLQIRDFTQGERVTPEYIKISNTTEENVLKNNPEMNTTKKDNSYHGYGIKNVSELVKKNNGTIEYIQLGVDIVQCRVLLML